LEWLAEMQTRVRAVRRGVAGKPTTTMAIPRCSMKRETAGSLAGLNNITGCREQEREAGMEQDGVGAMWVWVGE
jgi:hypothetical protein